MSWISPELIEILLTILKAVVILLVVVTCGAFMSFGERRLLGLFQNRYGPNRVGWGGSLQLVADMIKMFFKEDWIPKFSDRVIFTLAPMIAFTSLLLAFAIVPVSPGWVVADLNIGILFFLLVLFAALTSSIALTESAVATFEDELGWGRKKSTVVIGLIMIGLGTLSSLGYGPLGFVKILGMQFLDLFDFLTNSVMMPIAAFVTSLLVSRVVGIDKIEEEIRHGESKFRRKKIFVVMIKYLCPIFALIILLSSVANAFGWISM